jgi:hypothetical protein
LWNRSCDSQTAQQSRQDAHRLDRCSRQMRTAGNQIRTKDLRTIATARIRASIEPTIALIAIKRDHLEIQKVHPFFGAMENITKSIFLRSAHDYIRALGILKLIERESGGPPTEADYHSGLKRSSVAARSERLEVMHTPVCASSTMKLGDQFGCRIVANDQPQLLAGGFKRGRHVLRSVSGSKARPARNRVIGIGSHFLRRERYRTLSHRRLAKRWAAVDDGQSCARMPTKDMQIDMQIRRLPGVRLGNKMGHPQIKRTSGEGKGPVPGFRWPLFDHMETKEAAN